MNNIDALKGLGNTSPIRPNNNKKPSIDKSSDVPSFKETLTNFMSDVNSMQNKADESIEKMMTGEITDVHQVMNSVEEAKTAFNMMMQIRNKVMNAYDEVMRMRL